MKEALAELIQKLNDSLIESEIPKGKEAEARIQGSLQTRTAVQYARNSAPATTSTKLRADTIYQDKKTL